jgi:3-hydroxyacyl-CoA dehydrogenase
MIDNPPVNALSGRTAETTRDAILKAAADPAIAAIVVIGAGRTFPAGVDIREFSSGRLGTDFTAVFREIEDCPKPVVMAIHGTALGGGFELAMSGHYRVIAPGAQVGLPEVKLGLIPGASGTQRLPRLAGVAKALAMCVSGEPIGAREAVECGIADRVIEGDLLEGAKAFAGEVAQQPIRRTRDRHVVIEPAVRAAVTAVMASGGLAFEDGCRFEAEIFAECLSSSESKALIHVFFGERTVGKIPFLAADTPVLPIRRAAVAGEDLAMACAKAGIEVVGEDGSPDIVLAGEPGGSFSVGARLIGGLLEIQPGPATRPEILLAAMSLGKRLKKIAVHGFIAERMRKANFSPEEGQRLLEEGVALRPVDIDIACIHGCGFTRRLGGPMYRESLRASFLPSDPSPSA